MRLSLLSAALLFVFVFSTKESFCTFVPTQEIVQDDFPPGFNLVAGISGDRAILSLPGMTGGAQVLKRDQITGVWSFETILTLSEWGLISLAMAIGIIGLFAVRKKKIEKI